jgi:DNA-binding Lrp family transcriptional regulator
MIADGPGPRARAALCDYWDEPDSYVAKLADASKTTVLRARHELERLGVIPVREPDLSEDAWRPGPTWHARREPGLTPRQRALIEVEADPGASNQRLAERASCGRTTVRQARRELEQAGEIEVITATSRERRSQLGQVQERWDWAELPPQPASMQHGLCAAGGYPPDLWHSAQNDHAGRALAIAICRTPCPALADCATWSLSLPTSEKYAIFGGMSANERARRRRAQQAEAAAAAS